MEHLKVQKFYKIGPGRVLSLKQKKNALILNPKETPHELENSLCEGEYTIKLFTAVIVAVP